MLMSQIFFWQNSFHGKKDFVKKKIFLNRVTVKTGL